MQLSRTELLYKISIQSIRQLQVLFTAFPIGLVATLVVLGFYYFSGSLKTVSTDQSYLQTLTLINIFTSIALFYAGTVIFKNTFRKAIDSSGTELSVDETVEKIISAYRSALIVRFALFESAAMIGFIVCIFVITKGLKPIGILNGISIIAAIILMIKNIPTKAKIADIYSAL